MLFAARPTVAKHAQDAGAVPRGLGFWSEDRVLRVELGRLDVRGSGALPRPPEYQKAHNANELVVKSQAFHQASGG